MSNRTVDVIIPSYNGLPYLKEAVDSVLTQTHQDLELYIIDDGSVDKGATEKYAKGLKDSRVHYIKKENGGQVTARNYGIKISTSPFVTFLDADDIWDLDKLESQLNLLNQDSNLGMVYGLCDLIDANGQKVGKVTYEKRGQLFKYLLGGNRITGSASMVMIKREVFAKVGIFNEAFLLTGEDWEMWLRIAKSYKIDYVPRSIAQIRVLGGGWQSNSIRTARGLEDILPVMVKEFKLGAVDRAKLGTACLRPACLMYLAGGDQLAARKAFFRLLSYNPLVPLESRPGQWLAYFRIMFGSKWLRALRRKTSAKYRAKELERKRG